jgi:hypothetical protein
MTRRYALLASTALQEEVQVKIVQQVLSEELLVQMQLLNVKSVPRDFIVRQELNNQQFALLGITVKKERIMFVLQVFHVMLIHQRVVLRELMQEG